MTPEQFKEFSEKFGKEAAEKMQEHAREIEKNLSEKHAEVLKGKMDVKDFSSYKEEMLEEHNNLLKKYEKLEEAAKEQGNRINAMLEKGGRNSKTIEQFIEEQKPLLIKLRDEGKMAQFTGAQLKAAGVMSIAGSIEAMDSPPDSPYAPGLGGGILEFFDVRQNPNFIVTRVDVGRTNQSRLAWINETTEDGTVTEVNEGAPKPLIDTAFKVETSTAKKVAAHVKITEEFEDDIPGLATQVRRMLQDRVLRAWDDAIQNAVIIASRPYEITGMNADILDANLWDAVYAMMAQVRSYNYEPNTIGINPITEAKMKMAKATDGVYLLPSFAAEVQRLQVLANKVIVNAALVGDLSQYKVDIYKDFVLKMGWVNDDFIKNQFAIVGEIRYHRYISDNRKKALCYSDLPTIISAIDGTPGS